MNDAEILSFLLSRKIDPDWKKFLKKLVSIADECNKTVWKIMLIPEYHEYQKSKKNKTFEFNEVFEQVSKFMKDNQISDIEEALDCILESAPENYPGDPFFYPGLLIGQGQKYYSNDDARSFLEDLLSDTKFKPQIKKLMRYSLALKKAFALLAQKKYPKLDLILILWERLHVIKNIIDEEWKKLLEKEKERVRNRKNRLSATEQTIEKIKSDKSYPKIKKILSEYSDSRDQKNQLDTMIGKIIDTENRNTLRTYRRKLIEDFIKQIM